MEKIVVDTDIIINHARRQADSLVELLILQAAKKVSLFASTIVIFEFYSGAFMEKPVYVREADFIFAQFNIQELTADIAQLAATLNRRYNLLAKIGTADTLIAATCLYLDARLATANQRHFNLVPGIKFYKG